MFPISRRLRGVRWGGKRRSLGLGVACLALAALAATPVKADFYGAPEALAEAFAPPESILILPKEAAPPPFPEVLSAARRILPSPLMEGFFVCKMRKVKSTAAREDRW